MADNNNNMVNNIKEELYKCDMIFISSLVVFYVLLSRLRRVVKYKIIINA
jgi:hypothetical protein